MRGEAGREEEIELNMSAMNPKRERNSSSRLSLGIYG